MFGDPATTGKPAGDDLVEGKRTVLVALALDGAPAEDGVHLDGSLGTALSTEQVERLRRIIVDSGAHGQVESVIDELTRLSLDALDRAPIGRRGAYGAAPPGRGGHPARRLRISRAKGTSSSSGPSPRMSTLKRPASCSSTRCDSTLNATENARSSARANGPQPSHNSTAPASLSGSSG